MADEKKEPIKVYLVVNVVAVDGGHVTLQLWREHRRGEEVVRREDPTDQIGAWEGMAVHYVIGEHLDRLD